MSGNTPFQAVDSDVSPALLPLASQATTTVSTTVSTPSTSRGTVFPVSPVDLQEFIYTADATNGVEWHFKYNAAGGTYKWECIGGAPLVSEVTNADTTVSAVYAALANAGPAIVLPFAGDYDVTIGSRADNTNAAQGSIMSYDIGGTGAVDADDFNVSNAAGAAQATFQAWRTRRKTGLTAVTLTAKYKTSGAGTSTFSNRIMLVMPVRVSG